MTRRHSALGAIWLAWILAVRLAGAEETLPNQLRVEPDLAIQADAQSRLASGRYRFCTDDEYRLWQADKDRLCGRQNEVVADCKGLAAACERPAWDEKTEEPPSPSWLAELASLLGESGGALLRMAFWAALAAGAAYLLVRAFRTLRLSDGSTEEATSRAARPAVEESDPEIQPSGVLLQRAGEYLDAEDARRALHFVYAALLAGLAEAGRLRLHKALTTGDYRRSLRSTADDQLAGGLLWDLDIARFRHAIDGDHARHLLERVRGLLRGLSPLLLLLGIGGLPGCSTFAGPEGPFEPTGPRGYGLFEELAASKVESFSRRLRRVTELPAGTTAVVLLAPHLRKLEWDTLKAYVESGGHLIVAGQTEGLSEAFGFQTDPVSCTAPIQVIGLRTTTPDTSTASVDALPPQAADAVLATCGSATFARIHVHGSGQITLIGDESLLDNTSLAMAENASFVMALIDSAPGHLEFIGPWTGAGAVHPLESIARSGVGTWLLHLLMALALLAWARGRRFGTPRAPDSSTRRSLVEHARALSGHYRRQGDVGAALGRYAAWAVALLGKRSGSSTRDLHALSLALTQGRRGRPPSGVTAADLHQILLRARAGAELGGNKPKLMRAYGMLRSLVDDVASKK